VFEEKEMAINNDVALPMGRQPEARNDSRRGLRQGWIVVTTFLAVAVFAEAGFAGAMLSGINWALAAHQANAGVLMAASIAASLAAIITLRRVPQGRRLALSLSVLAVLLIVQAGVGALSAKGVNLLWVHVPLGAALLSFATQTMVRAYGLGRE
jgi:hypothetical protein